MEREHERTRVTEYLCLSTHHETIISLADSSLCGLVKSTSRFSVPSHLLCQCPNPRAYEAPNTSDAHQRASFPVLNYSKLYKH